MTLGSLLSVDQIVPEMKSTERWAAIVELIDLLVEKGAVRKADRESVCETIIHIGERAEVTRMRSAVPSAARIVLAPRSHIVEIGFDQNMSLRQRRRVLQGKFDHA